MAGTSDPALEVFILAKNEAPNIGRTLAALADCRWPVTVLDSGSTDATPDIVAAHPHARFTPYVYTTHLAAYNQITTGIATGATTPGHVMVLDADMLVSPALLAEVEAALAVPGWDALTAEVVMCVEGHPLARGSLYPPKPFVFRTGEAWFASLGHAEILRPGTVSKALQASLRHDDRKPYIAFLGSQDRYAESLMQRAETGSISWRDKLRTRTPIGVLAAPLLSLFGRMGILDGRAGLVYALDRMIAEAVMYRKAQARRLHERK